MSNIYIQEPPTNGKVLLETTVGDIDIELWSREAPKACRNFIQLCMEGYYNSTIFHRLVKDFIVQGGDPTGSGMGGHSVWGKPFKDELHSRLRFTRRGLLAMANSGKDDNGSQFFFTLAPTPELQNKHTIFGKVSGNTIYNMIKLGEGTVDEDEKPLYPHKVVRTKILSNPFEDIVPRETIKKEKTEKKVVQAAGTKNYKLLSFGAEAEEDEEEDAEISKMFTGKGKSSHDLANDPKLSSSLAVDLPPADETAKSDEDKAKELTVESVREKLKRDKAKPKPTNLSESGKLEGSDDDGEEYYLGKTEAIEKQKRLEALKKEVKNLKREMKKGIEEKETQQKNEAAAADEKTAKLAMENTLVKQFVDEQKLYRDKKAELKSKGDREAVTLALLEKFQKKIQVAKEAAELTPAAATVAEPNDDDEKEDDSWLAQTLHFEEEDPILAKDASLKSDDWFEIYDPRNPLTKRRRGEGEKGESSKKPKWPKRMDII